MAEKGAPMSEVFWTVRRLVTRQPDRVWTLREIADGVGLSLTDTKIAVERLVVQGELVRKGAEHYRRPVGSGI